MSNRRELMAIFGWDTLKEAERYTRNADQLRLAESAMPLLEGPEQNSTQSCPTERSGGTFSKKGEQTQSQMPLVVPRGGIEPPTPAFSVQCSTN